MVQVWLSKVSRVCTYAVADTLRSDLKRMLVHMQPRQPQMIRMMEA